MAWEGVLTQDIVAHVPAPETVLGNGRTIDMGKAQLNKSTRMLEVEYSSQIIQACTYANVAIGNGVRRERPHVGTICVQIHGHSTHPVATSEQTV